MRKIVSLTALMVAFVIAAQSQSIGVKIGSNFNNTRINGVSDQLNPNTDFKAGFVGGIFSDIELGNGLSFHPEVNYIQKGFVTEYGTDFNVGGINIPIGASIHTNLNYVEVAPLFKYSVGGDNAKVYFLAGPSAGYATSGTIKTKARAFFDFNVTNTDIDLNSDMYNRVDLGANVGVGASIKVGGGEIFGDVRYQHSFTSGLSDQMLNIDFKNSGISTNIGYAYHF